MVTFSEQDKQLTCTFAGRLDTAAVMKDELAVDEKIEQAPDRSVAFDLAGVTFIASSFLRLCLKTAKTVGVARFSVRRVTPEIKKVFVIAGMDKHLTIT